MKSRMRLRSHLLAVIVAVAAVCLVGFSIGHSVAFQTKTDGTEELNRRIQQGLGSLKFAAANDSIDQVRASVNSAAAFIRVRSGLTMSAETEDRLVSMEQLALNDPAYRIGAEGLVQAFTDTALDRLSTLTDNEIEQASRVFQRNGHYVSLRASGKYTLTEDDFLTGMKAARTAGAAADESLASVTESMIAEEVKARLSVFAQALPEHFGSADTEGLTPLQSLLLAYSLVTDDYLEDSAENLRALVIMLRRITQRDGSNESKQTWAFGQFGDVYATPAGIFFNKRTVSMILDRIAKGGGGR